MSAKRFLFVVFPALSHLTLTIPVARALRRAGHTVAYASNDTLKDIVEHEGFDYFEIGKPGLSEERLYGSGPDLSQMTGFPLGDVMFNRLFIPMIPSMARDLLRLVDRFKPDVLFADLLAYAAPIVHELTGVTWASYTPGLFMYPSKDLPPVGSALPPPRTAQDRKVYEKLNTVSLSTPNPADTPLNKIRARFGLPNGKHLVLQMSPLLVISFVPETFEYPRTDLPPQVHFVGPSLWNQLRALEASSIVSRLRRNEPLVYATLGTVFGGCRPMLDTFMKALADLDAQVIMTIGRFKNLRALGPLPRNVIIEPFIPHSLIFPSVDLVVCHAGFNTVLEALSYGIPLVCVPVSADNPEVAQRVQESGAGLRLSGMPTVKTLKEAMLSVLRQPKYKENAQRLGKSFRQCDGPAEAVRLLTELAETRRPVARRKAYWAGHLDFFKPRSTEEKHLCTWQKEGSNL